MKQDYEIIPGNLPVSSWNLVLNALEYYLTNEEQRLIQENAGESEWSRWSDYEGVRNDILYYVLPTKEDQAVGSLQ